MLGLGKEHQVNKDLEAWEYERLQELTKTLGLISLRNIIENNVISQVEVDYLVVQNIKPFTRGLLKSKSQSAHLALFWDFQCLIERKGELRRDYCLDLVN